MFVGEELLRAKKELNTMREASYYNALNGENTFEVNTDKEVIISGGASRLASLQDAYNAMFVDAVSETATVKQADGSLITCTQSEWDVLMKLMRAKGKESFIKNETLIAQIEAVTDAMTFAEIWSLIW